MFILLLYVMSSVVLLPFANSKIKFAVVSAIMAAQWIFCAGHQSKNIAAGGIQGANSACMMLQHM